MTTDILLAVAGMTPQVITETLYAILKEEPERFPKEIYIITTTEGAEKIRNNLLGANGKLNEFCNEYGLDSFKIDQDRHLKIIRDADNNLIEDARTREDQNIIADFIFNEVKELTALNDDNTPKYRIHASIAGGRKTMTYLLGATMNILGNPEDKLSHVLVSEGYETNRDFYFPTKTEKLIKGREEGVFLDCSKAKVELSEIPLMRLRTLLTNETQKLLTTYTGAVTEINNSLTISKKDLKLEIDTGSRTLHMITPDNRYSVTLDPRLFAVYHLIISKMMQAESFNIPGTTFTIKNFRNAYMLLIELFKYSTVYNDAYRSNPATFEYGEKEFSDILDELLDKEVEKTLKNPRYEKVQHISRPNWIHTLNSEINTLLGKSKAFLLDVADGRSFDQTHPFVEREDGNFLNINFLKAQHDLWSNAKGDVNEQIKEKVNRNYIADFYLLRYDQKKKTYMIDIDPENITII